MVGGSADDRQAQRHVHGVFEMEGLDRDQRLVVVHAERGIALARARAWNMVGQRARAQHALRDQGRDCGFDDLDFLATQCSAFAGVWIERCHRQPRLGDSEIALQAAERRASS